MEQPLRLVLRLILVYTGSAAEPDALWKLTHDGAAEREEWRMFTRSLNINVDELRVSNLPLLVRRAIDTPPCIIGRYTSGVHAIIVPSAMLEQINGNIELLINVLYGYSIEYGVDLGLPP